MGHYDDMEEQTRSVVQRCETSAEASFKLAEATNHLEAAVSCMVKDWLGQNCQPVDLVRAQFALSVLRGTNP